MQPTDHTSIAEAWRRHQHMPTIKTGRVQQAHVVRKAKHDLRGAVPPRRDVLGHEALLLRLVKPAREPKVANLQLAVRVHEQVARLEVAVQHVGRVDVLQAAERLVDEGLEVRVRERLAGTDLSLSMKMKERSVRSCVRAFDRQDQRRRTDQQ